MYTWYYCHKSSLIRRTADKSDPNFIILIACQKEKVIYIKIITLIFFLLCIYVCTVSKTSLSLYKALLLWLIDIFTQYTHIHTYIRTCTGRDDANMEIRSSIEFSLLSFSILRRYLQNCPLEIEEIEMSIKNKASFNMFWESLEKKKKTKETEVFLCP